MANDTNTTISWSGEDVALGLALVFCIMLLWIGFKERTFWLLAGPVWILCGITIFNTYHPAFMIITVGLGMVLLMWGAYDVYK